MEVKIIIWNNKIENARFAKGMKWDGKNPFYCLLYRISSKCLYSYKVFQLLTLPFLNLLNDISHQQNFLFSIWADLF